MSYALDTESSYSRERDIRSLGVHNYVRHPDTHHYLAAVYNDEVAWAGDPRDLPFPPGVALSHNAAYDQSVVAALGLPRPAEWHCTADLAAYLQAPRNLKDAVEELLNLGLDKSLRDNMKGVEWKSLSPDEQAEMAKYCLLDSKACFLLWKTFHEQWPVHEQSVSDHTAMMCQRGIYVDVPMLEAGIEKLQQIKFEAEQEIPWAGELNAKGKPLPVTSPKELAKHCRMLGIQPPASTDAKSEEWEAWEDAYADHTPFVHAVQRWRRANRLFQLFSTIRTRQDGGVLSYSLKYFGAHTGRWSGDAGVNLQNLPRTAFEGIDARGIFIPQPGHVLLVADYAQIEARVALWLANDREMLALLRSGVDLYEAHARATMGYSDPRPLKEVDPAKRQLAKVRVLALGFGLGAAKFQRIAKQWAGIDLTENEARNQVGSFRRANRGLLRLWRRLQQGFRHSKGGTLDTVLPSGRVLHYYQVGEDHARVQRGGPTIHWYGGKLFENLVQSTARDLLADAILRVESAGLPVRLHVHDEIVAEVPEEDAEEGAAALKELMERAPEWAAGLPVEVEVSVKERYAK